MDVIFIQTYMLKVKIKLILVPVFSNWFDSYQNKGMETTKSMINLGLLMFVPTQEKKSYISANKPMFMIHYCLHDDRESAFPVVKICTTFTRSNYFNVCSIDGSNTLRKVPLCQKTGYRLLQSFSGWPFNIRRQQMTYNGLTHLERN